MQNIVLKYFDYLSQERVAKKSGLDRIKGSDVGNRFPEHTGDV